MDCLDETHDRANLGDAKSSLASLNTLFDATPCEAINFLYPIGETLCV